MRTGGRKAGRIGTGLLVRGKAERPCRGYPEADYKGLGKFPRLLLRARVASGDLPFARPVSFAIRQPGKDDRFVTSFRTLEDKVILRQVAKYLRRLLDARLSDDRHLLALRARL